MSRVPAYMYHKDSAPKVFETEEELDFAMEDGWVDSPEKVEASVTSASPPAPEPPSAQDEAATIMAMSRGQLAAFYKGQWGETMPYNVKLDELRAAAIARLNPVTG